MSLGSQLIDELARRRELGMYFDYAGYRALRRVDSAVQLSHFLRERGFPEAPQTTDLKLVADWLQDTTGQDECQSLWTWIAVDPLGGIIALPIWLLSRLATTRERKDYEENPLGGPQR
jgi:hypothetical protein